MGVHWGGSDEMEMENCVGGSTEREMASAVRRSSDIGEKKTRRFGGHKGQTIRKNMIVGTQNFLGNVEILVV